MARLDVGDRRGWVAAAASSERRRLNDAPGDATTERRAWRAAMVVCVAAALVRLIIAATTPLFPDETYYWEWSRRLAAGYFDHPPVIAWITAAGRKAFGDTPLGVRMGSVVLGAVASIALCAAARRLARAEASLFVALVFALMPLSAAGLVLATPDAPLFAGASIAWYAIVRALEHAPGIGESLRWWCVAGLALGVALASKYTGILLPFAVFVACCVYAPLRARLREPGPYVASAIAVLVFLPVLVWNARHEWISLAFQLGHGLSRSSGSVLDRELEMVGGQAGLVSPVLFVLCAIAVWRALRTPTGQPVDKLLAIATVVIFGFFMYSATKRRVEANWPALAYLPAMLLLGRTPGWRRARSVQIGLGIAAVLTVVAYANAYAPILPVRAARDPAARAAGWERLAAATARYVRVDSTRVHVSADRYQDASELAFHLPGHPPTFALNLGGRPNQYGLWPGFEQTARVGDDLIVVLDDVAGVPPQITALTAHFGEIIRGDSARLERGGDLVKQFRLWRLRGWRGTWPRAELRSRS